MPRRRLHTPTDDVLDPTADCRERDAERLECPRCYALALVDESEQEVLGTDVVVAEQARFFLSQHDDPAGPVSEALEHDHSMPRQTSPVRALASAGAGFLLAVLWFDLMFDVQVRGHAGAELPEQVLSSIAAYYARVTTTSRPMSRLVVLAMLTTIGALLATLFGDDLPNWRAAIALVLTLVAVNLAGAHTVPAAVRLGARRDDATTQTRIARSILRDHLVCIAAIALTLLVLLLPA